VRLSLQYVVFIGGAAVGDTHLFTLNALLLSLLHFAAAQNANNVLVSSCEASPNGLVAKLADLGLSRVINQHRTHRTTHTVSSGHSPAHRACHEMYPVL
jgi:hypothetical protein